MSAKSKIGKERRLIMKNLVLSNLRKREFQISEQELRFFKEHPLELDKLTSTAGTKKVYLMIAVGLGFILVAVSIALRASGIGTDDGQLHGLFTELMFETGVALFGAAITVYLLEIVLHRQEILNRHYRQLVKHEISLLEEEDDD